MKAEAEENIKKIENKARQVVRQATKKEIQASIAAALASNSGKSTLTVSQTVVLAVQKHRDQVII
jgi:hypothetical protein